MLPERSAPDVPKPPVEFFDEDSFLSAVRTDDCTRGQAKAIFVQETGEPFADIRVRKGSYRFDEDYVAEQIADGISEPYDGWPWFECGPGEDGPTYWIRVADRG